MLSLLAPAEPVRAQAPTIPPPRRRWSPRFSIEQTLAVARIDLRKIDVTAAVKTLGEIVPAKDAELAKQLPAIEQMGQRAC